MNAGMKDIQKCYEKLIGGTILKTEERNVLMKEIVKLGIFWKR
jgi:hypothetical protein